MTIVVGAAPIINEEVEALIGVNATAHRLVQAGDIDGLHQLLEGMRAAMLADPIGAFRGIMDKAPESDREVMTDPLWQEAFSLGVREALRQGIAGWADEAIVIHGQWDDVDLEAVAASVTWWHAAGDANAPLSAARRIIERLPAARLVLFDEYEGHLAAYRREGEILDELLARA